MDRRTFIGITASGALAVPFVGRAQQPAKIYRIGFLGSTSASAYASRVEALRTGLRGDVSAVVAKALETNPELRYRSASELADDLQRVLDRRPIRARST